MKVTINGFVHAIQRQDYCPETGRYVPALAWEVYPFDMSQSGGNRVLLGEQEFTIEVPDEFDIRLGLVENLEREKKRAGAEYQKRVTELNAQIQSLLAIESAVTEVV